MTVSEASVPTTSASRYLAQLCKHWSHKFPETTFDAEQGRVPFAPDRACVFSANSSALSLRLEVADPAALDRMEQVVVDHLKRFAFREDLGEISWSRKI